MNNEKLDYDKLRSQMNVQSRRSQRVQYRTQIKPNQNSPEVIREEKEKQPPKKPSGTRQRVQPEPLPEKIQQETENVTDGITIELDAFK